MFIFVTYFKKTFFSLERLYQSVKSKYSKKSSNLTQFNFINVTQPTYKLNFYTGEGSI